jgi:HD-like signal output (HDOD) protein
MAECPYCHEPIATGRPDGAAASLYACQACLNPCQVLTRESQVVTKPLPDSQDIRTYAPPESLGGAVLSVLREAIDQMPLLPEIAQRALGLAQDDKASIADLSALISQDAVIALKVLKMANSALYGGLHTISDLKSACARLGMRTVATILEAAATEGLYKTSYPLFADLVRQLWRHGLVTAYCAGEISRLVSEPRPDVAFVCGLIHDIGRLVLLDIVSRRQSETRRALRDSPQVLFELLDSFHALVGLHVVQRWQLSSEFAVATYCHHAPHTVPEEALLTGCHIICLADEVAAASGYGFGPREAVSLVAHPSTRYLGLTDIKLAAFRVDLEDRVASLLEALEA